MAKKQRLIILSALLCILIMLFTLSACDDSDGKNNNNNNNTEEYSVTLDYDNTLGSVTVTAPANGDKYDKDEQVTVTVTPTTQYEVSSFKVDDEECALTDSTYTFAIQQNTTVSVTFEPVVITYFDITAIKFNKNRGNVVVSAPQNGSRYVYGEEVTVTMTPNEKYRAQTITINNVTTHPINNTYTFWICFDTEISVEFIPAVIGVNTTYQPSRGSVTLSPELPDGVQYGLNEEVTVTIKCNEGFTIRNITLNGSQITLENDSYTFTVTGKVDLNVDFAGAGMSSELYDTLKGQIRFNGEYYYDATDDEYDMHHLIETIYGQNDQIYQFDADAETGVVYYDQIYTRDPNNRSKLALMYLDLDNTVKWASSTDLYSQYANPFNYILRYTDFELDAVSDDGEYIYAIKTPSSSNSKKAASAITGWNEQINSFLLYVKDDVATKLVIRTASIESQGFSYVSTYEFEINDIGTAQVEEIKPFERDEQNHSRLEQALAKADEAEFYTIRHQAHEIGFDSEDLDYFKYVTEDMFFSNYEGWEYGYKVIKGYVYPFSYSTIDNKVVLDDAINDVFDNITAHFTLNASTEIFAYVGNNAYVLQNALNFAPYIVTNFGEGQSEKKYYSYATSLIIILDDNGNLYQIKFRYSTYGITEDVILTYDFNTKINLDYLDFESADHNSVLDPFIGRYEDEYGNFAIVDMYGFVINGYEAKVVSYSKDDCTFVATWQNTTIYIDKFSQRQLRIYDDGIIYWILNSVYDSSVTIPEQFKGHWFRAKADLAPEVAEYLDADLDFVIQTHAIYYNGNLMEILSYTLSEGIVASYKGSTYSFTLAHDEEDTVYLAVIIMRDDGATAMQIFAEYVDENIGIEIPDQYVGTYINVENNQRVDITYTSITVNGEAFIPSSYTQNGGFVGTLGSDNSYTMLLVNNGYLQIKGQEQTLKRMDVMPLNYVGTWIATFGFEKDENNPADPNAKPYKLIITDTSITFIRYNRDGSVLDEEVISSDGLVYGDYGCELHLSWNPYTVYLLYTLLPLDKIPMLYIFDNDELFVSLSKQSVYDTDITLSDDWDGTYFGKTSDNKPITVTVTVEDTTVHISIDSTEQQAIIVEYDESAEMLEVTLGGTTYYIFLNQPEKGQLNMLEGVEDGEEIVLTRI